MLAEIQRKHREAAIEELTDALNKYPPLATENPILAVKAWFQLGRAYEAMALQDEAVRAYSRFLKYWGDCDFPSAEVEHARDVVQQASS